MKVFTNKGFNPEDYLNREDYATQDEYDQAWNELDLQEWFRKINPYWENFTEYEGAFPKRFVKMYRETCFHDWELTSIVCEDSQDTPKKLTITLTLNHSVTGQPYRITLNQVEEYVLEHHPDEGKRRYFYEEVAYVEILPTDHKTYTFNFETFTSPKESEYYIEFKTLKFEKVSTAKDQH